MNNQTHQTPVDRWSYGVQRQLLVENILSMTDDPITRNFALTRALDGLDLRVLTDLHNEIAEMLFPDNHEPLTGKTTPRDEKR